MILGDLLSGLLQPLRAVLCWVQQIGAMVADAAVWALNSVVSALAGLVVSAIALLPGMPDLPTMPTYMQTGIAWVGEFWPVGTTVDVTVFVTGCWLTWLVVGMALRWAKVIG